MSQLLCRAVTAGVRVARPRLAGHSVASTRSASRSPVRAALAPAWRADGDNRDGNGGAPNRGECLACFKGQAFHGDPSSFYGTPTTGAGTRPIDIAAQAVNGVPKPGSAALTVLALLSAGAAAASRRPPPQR